MTDEHLWTAARYYSILTRGLPELLYVVYTIIVLGGATIFWSLSDGEAGNLMFDGGSIGEHSEPQSTSLSHTRARAALGAHPPHSSALLHHRDHVPILGHPQCVSFSSHAWPCSSVLLD